MLGRDTYLAHRARRHIAFLPAVPDQPDFLTIRESWSLMAAIRGRPRWPGQALEARFKLEGHMRLSHASAGQRRRAELIAATAGDPEVLLLDEVFANQDDRARAVLEALLQEWRATRVILFTGTEKTGLPVDRQWKLTLGEPLTL